MKTDLEFLRFKEDRLRNQFWLASKTSPCLIGMTIALGNWIFQELSTLKPLIITAVWRNPEEQKILYNSETPPNSPHYCNPLCRAIDFRAKNDYFNEGEREQITIFLNTFFKRTDGKPTVIWHSVADEFHGHLQCGAL